MEPTWTTQTTIQTASAAGLAKNVNAIIHFIFCFSVVHPKMKILSFTQPHIVPNLDDVLSSLEHTRYFEKQVLSIQ